MSPPSGGKYHAKLNLTCVFSSDPKQFNRYLWALPQSQNAEKQEACDVIKQQLFFFGGGGAAPVAHHVDFKEYFFELYYPHMSLENTLGNSRRLLKVFPPSPAVRGAAPHIVSWLHHKYFNQLY